MEKYKPTGTISACAPHQTYVYKPTCLISTVRPSDWAKKVDMETIKTDIDEETVYLRKRVILLETDLKGQRDILNSYMEMVEKMRSLNNKQAFELGNQGYRIKNQRHEINNRLKEISGLKELLKECAMKVYKYAAGSELQKEDKEFMQQINEVLQ